MFRRKIIRNRFHLWVFLNKNPKMIKYRARESDIGDLVASHYTIEESEVHINSGSTENEEVKSPPNYSINTSSNNQTVNINSSSSSNFHEGRINYSSCGSNEEEENI